MEHNHPLRGERGNDWLQQLPEALRKGLLRLATRKGARLYAAGGMVRDMLYGQKPRDLDFVVDRDPLGFARELAAELEATLVILDEETPVARVVWRQLQIDFSGFRKEATSIEGDLRERDFTINAMAVLLVDGNGEFVGLPSLIDPTGGLDDLGDKIIRACSSFVFDDDPLRLLRAYRFMGALDFILDPLTRQAIAEKKDLLVRAAPERLKYEFDLLLASAHSTKAIREMAASGLFFELFPQARDLDGCRQPESHHLDVLQHSLQALEELEKLFCAYSPFFTQSSTMTRYIAQGDNRILLKWAILFHDIGKPAVQKIVADRITFRNHDHVGARLFEQIATGLHWSKRNTRRVCQLIAGHMWPFHLNNVFRKNGVTKRACLRLTKKFGEDLPGLFLLAMADSLAGQGPAKPAGLEHTLAELYERVQSVISESLQPGFNAPPFINGHDLIDHFHLTPGPLFRRILTRVRDAQICGEILTREEALRLVAALAEKNGVKG